MRNLEVNLAIQQTHGRLRATAVSRQRDHDPADGPRPGVVAGDVRTVRQPDCQPWFMQSSLIAGDNVLLRASLYRQVAEMKQELVVG